MIEIWSKSVFLPSTYLPTRDFDDECVRVRACRVCACDCVGQFPFTVIAEPTWNEFRVRATISFSELFVVT